MSYRYLTSQRYCFSFIYASKMHILCCITCFFVGNIDVFCKYDCKVVLSVSSCIAIVVLRKTSVCRIVGLFFPLSVFFVLRLATKGAAIKIIVYFCCFIGFSGFIFLQSSFLPAKSQIVNNVSFDVSIAALKD